MEDIDKNGKKTPTPKALGTLDGVSQSQYVDEYARLWARVARINSIWGLKIEINIAKAYTNGIRQHGQYGYRWPCVAGGSMDFYTMWNWLNGIEAGLGLAQDIVLEAY